MKLRWSNGYSFAFEFEANDHDSFRDQALSALRSFRIASRRKVHRGEIHKTVWQCRSCSLHVYDDQSHNWYGPEGEPTMLDTKSFGKISLNRHFEVAAPFIETDLTESMLDNYTVNLTCSDPFNIEQLGLAFEHNTARIWNLCVGVYEHAQAINTTIMSVGDAIDRHIRDES